MPIMEKLTEICIAQYIKTDTNLDSKKQIVMILKTVSFILLNFMKLDTDSIIDFEKINSLRKLIFDTLYSTIKESYNDSIKILTPVINEKPIEEKGIQRGERNKDSKTLNKEITELHQLIIETLAFSNVPEFIEIQFMLYKQIYTTANSDIRKGILKNLECLLYITCKDKKSVKEMVINNRNLYVFIEYILDNLQDNEEKLDISLLHFSKILKILALSLPNINETSSDFHSISNEEISKTESLCFGKSFNHGINIFDEISQNYEIVRKTLRFQNNLN